LVAFLEELAVHPLAAWAASQEVQVEHLAALLQVA
jgi:hypothetical protein